MKRGFTLIELLVVISIVAVLASVLFIRVSLAQSKARDVSRIQQIKQIDLATRLYTEEHGHPPDFNGICAAQSSEPVLNPESACFTISTSGTVGENWDQFKEEIKPFLSSIPNDPCPTCDSESGLNIGYTYIPPLLMQYKCYQENNGTCPLSQSELNRSYQIYAPLERSTIPAGGSSNNAVGLYHPTSPNTPSGPAPVVTLSAAYQQVETNLPNQSPNVYVMNWSISNAVSCVTGGGYTDGDGNWVDANQWLIWYTIDAILRQGPITSTITGSDGVVFDYGSIPNPNNSAMGDIYLDVTLTCTGSDGQQGFGSTMVTVKP